MHDKKNTYSFMNGEGHKVKNPTRLWGEDAKAADE
jgi:hypothetical protein